jgi:hypothetical protein
MEMHNAMSILRHSLCTHGRLTTNGSDQVLIMDLM